MKLKLSKLMFIMSGVAFALFALFTILIMTVDVKVVGPDGAKVGFADFNTAIFNAFGTNHTAEVISDILGYLIILFGAVFAGLFLYQWIKRKSLKKVNIELFNLMIFYVVLAIIYVLFLFIKINYRPILVDGKLEASYPSSHTLLFCSIALVSMFYLVFFTKNNIKLLRISQIAIGFVCLAGIICRLLSGTHWVTDIIGAILLSGALAFALLGTNYLFIEKNMVQQEETKGAEEKAPLKEIEAKE